MALELVPNPSHLEVVNPIMMGLARARQRVPNSPGVRDMRGVVDETTIRYLPWIKHTALVMCDLVNVDFMMKDSKRFADSGGWGFAAFDYDAATASFRPADMKSKPPQGNDAKCGFACHTVAQKRDFVFTEFPNR